MQNRPNPGSSLTLSAKPPRRVTSVITAPRSGMACVLLTFAADDCAFAVGAYRRGASAWIPPGSRVTRSLTGHHHRSAVKGAAAMAKKESRKAKRHVSKMMLRLPDLDQAKSAVLNTLSSVDAQRGYRHAIDEFVIHQEHEPTAPG